MTDADSDGSNLGTLLDLLGNETRMRIMQALWEEFEFPAYVIDDLSGTSFTALRENAAVADSGNFNYHLKQLIGHLVETQGDGYTLTPLGYNLMKNIDRFTGFKYESLDPWPVDPCPFCDDALVARYRRGLLEVTCEGCGGFAGGGNFTFVELATTGIHDLDQDQLLDAAIVALSSKVHWSSLGICWECHSHIDVTLDVCDEHERGPDGLCRTCDHRFRAIATASCEACATVGSGPVIEYAVFDPSLVSFFRSNEGGPREVGPWTYRLNVLASATETVVATAPTQVEIAIDRDGQTCSLSLTECQRGVEYAVESPGPLSSNQETSD